VSGSSNSTKQGQQAATKRARAALANQDQRRARRPLESERGKASTPTARKAQQPSKQPKLDLRPAAGEAEKGSLPDTPALLRRYGITTVARPVYEWGGYRYTNPSDAIAAAKRGGSA
jgi:hypothetical protein